MIQESTTTFFFANTLQHDTADVPQLECISETSSLYSGASYPSVTSFTLCQPVKSVSFPKFSKKKPQSFRDDPDRKKLRKTQLCSYFKKGEMCPWGDECGFAHGKSELRFQGLLESAKAGILDLKTFRRWPCLTHVSTGSCPFGDRCENIHDKKVDGTHKHWLPHCKRPVKNLQTCCNVDYTWFSKMLPLYYGNPFGKDFDTTINSKPYNWGTFQKAICNITGDIDVIHNNKREMFNNSITYCQMLQIALNFRINFSHTNRRKFYPSHLLYGEPCMIMQKSYFEILSETSVAELSAHLYKKQIKSHVVVYELAFGYPDDPGCIPTCIWCNIPDEAIVPCNDQQLKLHKKAQNRIQKDQKRLTEKRIENVDLISNCFDSFVSMFGKPFRVVYPADKDCFDLCTKILENCMNTICANLLEETSQGQRTKTFLQVQRMILEKKSQSLKDHLSFFAWPANEGSEVIHDQTPKPPVDADYTLPCKMHIKKSTATFHQKLWQSFLSTICQDDNLRHSRIQTFMKLRKGLSIASAREVTPVLSPPNPITSSLKYNDLSEDNRCWRDILLPSYYNAYESEWDKVKKHYTNTLNTL